MDTREIPATKVANTAAPHRIPGDICAIAITKTFLTQNEIILEHTGMCCLLLPQNKEYMKDLLNFFLKGYAQYN